MKAKFPNYNMGIFLEGGGVSEIKIISQTLFFRVNMNKNIHLMTFPQILRRGGGLEILFCSQLSIVPNLIGGEGCHWRLGRIPKLYLLFYLRAPLIIDMCSEVTHQGR